MIDLRSDTVTKPSKGMLEAMWQAEVGDDVFQEDPTVIALEKKAAEIFGKEAAIFCPSGTMTNQIAIRVHTQPQDEVICDRLSHVYNYEGGGIAYNSLASVRLLEGDRGRITAEMVAANINADDIHYPVTSLVCLENTVNKGGGCIYNIDEIRKIRSLCDKHNLKMHLDGARFFNALVETGETPEEYGILFDSISICLSKGLGAPVGSLLIGNQKFITKAKRVRKVLGGGMRQAGYLAAAGIYALDHQVVRLKEDHVKAREIAAIITNLPFVTSVLPVETNIIIFSIDYPGGVNRFLQELKSKGVLAVKFGENEVRLVTHIDLSEEKLNKFVKIIKSFLV
ncbi:MAG: threonine aldolase family protein [Cyclobacteriaceae bacterium]